MDKNQSGFISTFFFFHFKIINLYMSFQKREIFYSTSCEKIFLRNTLDFRKNMQMTKEL